MKRIGAPLLACLLVCATLGCDQGPDWLSFGKKEEPPPPPRPERLDQVDAVRQGAIGSVAFLGSAAPLTVKGFGLVVGLDGSGSADVTESIREYVARDLRKAIAARKYRLDPDTMTAESLLRSPDTAVVELTGVIEAGAVRGQRFDVRVTPATGASARSLAGGLLLPTELKVFGRATSGRGLLPGRTVAVTRGPIFVSPFIEEQQADANASRRGVILGGGVTLEARPQRLLLREPSYATASRIEQRIRERFPNFSNPAEAISQSYVQLITPRNYAHRPSDFARLVAYLYLDASPINQAQRLRSLILAAGQPGAPLEDIALAWEGIGPNVAEAIQPFYAEPEPDLRFYAARTGLRVGDPQAIEPMTAIASNPDSTYRLDAIAELGRSRSVAAARALQPMLGERDPIVRVAAYEALLIQRHRSITSIPIAHVLASEELNFMLDLVDAAGPPLIHVRRGALPRVAIFGSRARLKRPLFYQHEDFDLTLNANFSSTVSNESDPTNPITLIGRVQSDMPRITKRISGRADELVLTLATRPRAARSARSGFGYSYSAVAEVLRGLSERGILNAPVIFERISVRELVDRPVDAGRRREAEEISLEAYERQLRDESETNDASFDNGADSGYEVYEAPDFGAARPESRRPE